MLEYTFILELGVLKQKADGQKCFIMLSAGQVRMLKSWLRKKHFGNNINNVLVITSPAQMAFGC